MDVLVMNAFHSDDERTFLFKGEREEIRLQAIDTMKEETGVSQWRLEYNGTGQGHYYAGDMNSIGLEVGARL